MAMEFDDRFMNLAGPPRSEETDTNSISDALSSTSIESDGTLGQDQRFQLPEEEDPGPGDILVKIAGSSVTDSISKQQLALKSLYFRSYLARFHKLEKKTDSERSTTVELNAEFVSEEAWKIILQYITQDIRTEIKNGETAIAVLEASNYLQIESLQNYAVIHIKKYINRSNHLVFHNNFVASRGIKTLGEYINSTIIKPAESVRRRKYGKFDLTITLGQFQFRCHKFVVSAASKKIEKYLSSNLDCDHIRGEDIGVNCQNAQHVYNLLELIYIDREAISFVSVDDAVSVLKTLQDLQFHQKYYETCYCYFKKNVTSDNFVDLYRTGKNLSLKELVNICLYFFMFNLENQDWKEKSLQLEIDDLCKVLSHSYLNVASEQDVLHLAMEWLHQNDETMNHAVTVLKFVRWGLLTSQEIDHWLKSMEQQIKDENVMKTIRKISNDQTNKEPRGWPQMLLLSELYDCSKGSSNKSTSSHPQEYFLHVYDFSTKNWGKLTKDLGHLPFSHLKKSPSGSISMSKVSNDNIVFTKTVPANSFSRLPFFTSVYNVWTDSWSYPYQEHIDDEKLRIKPHNSVAVNDDVYVAFKEEFPKGDVVCLNSVKHITSDNPVYTITQYNCPKNPKKFPTSLNSSVQLLAAADTVNVIDDNLVCSYNIKSNTWRKTQIQGDIVSCSWRKLPDGKILRVGGLDLGTKTPSKKCRIYNSLEEEPRSIGDLVKERVEPSVTVYKKLIFVAGGLTRSRKRRGDWDDEDDDSPKTIFTPEPSVEYYVPDLDCWNLLQNQPQVSPGSRLSLVLINTPIRMMDVVFASDRGVKRQFVSE